MRYLIVFLTFLFGCQATTDNSSYRLITKDIYTGNIRKEVTVDMFPNKDLAETWSRKQSLKLESRITKEAERKQTLLNVFYEANRSGVDPDLVLSLIENVSNFQNFLVRNNNSIGYMQLPKRFIEELGGSPDELYYSRINFRLGCNLLRNYLDEVNGDIFLALQKYLVVNTDETISDAALSAKKIIALYSSKWK